jgi:hypothetical protein
MPVKIELQDEITFIGMMSDRLPFKGGDKSDIEYFLRNAGLTDEFIQNNVWAGPQHNLAEKVFHLATDHRHPLETRRTGYTVLGGIVAAYLDRQLVGREWALYITSFTIYYQLVEWNHASLDNKLGMLLELIVEYMRTGVCSEVVEVLYAARNDTRTPPLDWTPLMRSASDLLRAVPPKQWEELHLVLS